MLLNNPRPKCIEVKSTEGINVVVDYEAPDLVTLDGLDEADGTSDAVKNAASGGEDASSTASSSNVGPDEARKDAANKGRDKSSEGLDKQWNEKSNKIKMDQARKMKEKGGTTKVSDIGIQISEKGDATLSQARHRFAKYKKQGRMKPPAKISQDVNSPTGTVSLEATRDGIVEICVQSLSASHASPSLIHLSVREDLAEKREQEREKSDSRHMSNLEATLRGLIRRMAMIQKTADHAKEQEYQFHEASIQMNKAIKMWPILHCLMLLVTGCFMAKHMTDYLKGHHIY